MNKAYDDNIFRRITVNLTKKDNDQLTKVLDGLKAYYGPTSTAPSVSLILAKCLSQFFTQKGPEGLESLWAELQEAGKKRSDR